MKREVRLLREKAIDSLILTVEHFNRPWDTGRRDAVLILLDHAFEMLLKAAILQRGGRIRRPRSKETIGFESCVRIAHDGPVKFITSEQALTLQIINGLRDAAQHHLVEVSEEQLYLHAQAGLTLFRDLLRSVFSQELREEIPERVLPVSTMPPLSLTALFEREVNAIRSLLGPRSRRRTEAAARLRGLAIVDGSIQGENLQPSDSQLRKVMATIRETTDLARIFPGVAGIDLTPEGTGQSLSLRLSKKEGIPVQLVPEGTPGASVVAVRRVDELGFYNLGRDQIAQRVGLTGPKTTAVIRHLDLASDPDCYKQFEIGKIRVGRYSQKAIDRITGALQTTPIEEIWKTHGIKARPHHQRRREQLFHRH